MKRPQQRKLAPKRSAKVATQPVAKRSSAATSKPVAKPPIKKATKRATKSATKVVATPGKQTLPAVLHQVLALQLRHKEAFGKALTKALKSLDVDAEDHPEQAAALLEAVELTPAMLARVKHYRALELDDINVAVAYWDGEEDPFPLSSPNDLLALPNLEHVDSLPEPPTDVTPLLSLPKLRRIELEAWTFKYYRSPAGQSGSRKVTNRKAREKLEAAGFKLSKESTDQRWIFER